MDGKAYCSKCVFIGAEQVDFTVALKEVPSRHVQCLEKSLEKCVNAHTE